VLSFAIQALGQTQGLKAFNLDGTTINPVDGHGFVRVDIKSKLHTLTFDQVMPYEDWIKNKSSITPALSRAFESDDPMSALTRFASKILYKGYAVKTRVHSLISDPGWADYGVTPDQFARMPVTIALNPIPIDSNRAANGLSAHRTLADVSERMGLTSSPFAKETRNQKDLSAAQREELLKLFRHSGRSCSQLF
jgi:hypothetical protein